MAAKSKLTDLGVRAALADAKRAGRPRWGADGAILKGRGGLQLYAGASGTGRWFYRYTAPDGRKVRLALGPLAFEPTPGALTLGQARDEAGTKAALYARDESRDVRAFEQAERERAAAAKRAAEEAHYAALRAEVEAANEAERQRAARRLHSLQLLFAEYVAHLRKQGKSSARDAENLFRNHVAKAHPEIAAKPANEVTSDDVVLALRTLTEAGKGRTAAKLRSYLRAAYAVAVGAKSDPDAPAAFLPFEVRTNPVADTGALSKYNVARERALSETELRELWAAVQEAPTDAIHDGLRLLLLLGGQRPAQLMRAAVADVDLTAHTIALRDPKGRRTQARLHVLPLTEAAETVVARCLARAQEQESPHLFSTHGRAPVRAETVTVAAGAIAAALLAKPKAERVIASPFQLRDLRRTCETRLAALGISRDLRAQLQSHGLGGVQGRHYDKHTYMDEKRAALDAWAAFLETKPAANVHQLRQAAA